MKTIFDPGGPVWSPSIEYVYMKARRADFHLQFAEKRLREWVASNPYTIREEDNLDRTRHAFVITPTRPPDEEIALSVADFVNCLRASLDQLAWNLVHLFPATVPTDEMASQVSFPICRTDKSYWAKRGLFDPSIHGALDSLQPNDRTNAIHTHHLWQLDKLWNLDKHRTMPVNCGNWLIKFPHGITGIMDTDGNELNQRFVVIVPCLSRIQLRPSYVKPQIIPDILFGEYMGDLAIDIKRLREIHTFVADDVIPKFTGFFPYRPAPQLWSMFR